MRNIQYNIKWIFLILAVESLFIVIVVFPSRGLNFNYSSLFKGGQSVYENQHVGRDFNVAIEVIMPEFSSPDQTVVFKIKNIDSLYPDIDYQKASKICIKDLQILVWTVPHNQDWQSEYFPFLDKPVCNDLAIDPNALGMELKRVKFETDFSFASTFLLDTFYYPYDGFSYIVTAFIKYEVFDVSGKRMAEANITPNIYFTNRVGNEWYATTGLDIPLNKIALNDETLTTKEYDTLSQLLKNSPYQVKIINIQRPLLIRILYPLFVLLLLLFIGLLAFLDNLDSFLSAALTVIFGIYAIRQVVVPESMSVQSVVDISTASLYLWFFIISVIQIFRFSLSAKQSNTRNKIRQKPSKRNRNS